MSDIVSRQYGSWKSPITADLIVAGAVRLSQIRLDGPNIHWVEMRLSEKGRNVIVKYAADGTLRDLTPRGFNARTRSHEYGGGAFAAHGGIIYFSNYEDQGFYKHLPDEHPVLLTPPGKFRFADSDVDVARSKVIAVMEDHTTQQAEEVNSIVAISASEPGNPEVLVSGNDFYSNPVLQPGGSQLAWLTWNHPNMPWDGTELWLAALDNSGKVSDARKIAGGPDESVFQPQWSPDGTLYFVSDRSGWWNLYRLRGGRVECICERKAEFGMPQWVFGQSTYGFRSEREIVCAFCDQGLWNLATLDTDTQELEIIDLPFSYIDCLRVNRDYAFFIAASPVSADAVVRLDLESRDFEVLRTSTDLKLDSTFFSRPQPVEFPTADNQQAHAYFYPPQSRDFSGPPGERPPLIIKSHGGPTGSTPAALEMRIQFWTSRGFAVMDVNYRGSTGYGRDYRKQLNGQWGIADVEDCVNAARFLVEKDLVDANRVAIAGGSAGGFTTLSALTFHDFFKAGASYYGICDLEAMTKDTHKFEARYLDRLVGPYPERRDLYRARSPINFTDRLSCPVILMQGLDDPIVLPNQAEMMLNALRDKKLPVAYMPFEGEQHGFRQARNIKRSLEAELYFYSRVFRFELADEIEPVEIHNL